MMTQLYSIYDTKSKVYGKPFHALNENVAIRACKDAMTDPNVDFGRHPEDFILFHIGQYNDNTGEIEPTVISSIVKFLELRDDEVLPFPLTKEAENG
jgi:hypothetical protein